MYSDKITFVIFTFNEEARIERVVRNFAGHGQVLVLDDGSTDRTKAMAERLGATVLQRKKAEAGADFVESEQMSAFVKEVVTTPWIYWGFADEIVGRGTMDAMLEAVESGKYGIVDIARKNYYYGRFVHNVLPSRQTRAFRKEAVDFRGNQIHHFGTPTVPESQICRLDANKYFVHHFISNTAQSYLRSIDKYTEIDSKGLPERSALGTMVRLAKHFIQSFFLHGGWKAGRAGFYLTLQMACYQMLLSMKLHEHHQGLDAPRIEQLNNEFRDHLLNELKATSMH